VQAIVISKRFVLFDFTKSTAEYQWGPGFTLALAPRCMYNIIMTQLKFEWDPEKAEANRKRHKIAFEEAVSVFSDENALVIPDPDHSAEEARFVLLGMSWSLRILVVCHCFRKNDQIIRIFSARKATKAESKQYGPKP